MLPAEGYPTRALSKLCPVPSVGLMASSTGKGPTAVLPTPSSTVPSMRIRLARENTRPIFLPLISVHEILDPYQKTKANCSIYFCNPPNNSIYYRAVRDFSVCVLLKQNSCGKTILETIRRRIRKENIEDHILPDLY